MAVTDQESSDRHTIYNGDCCEVLTTLPDESIHLSVYSPPFAADGGGCLYQYSSSERDLSNCKTAGEFFEHYGFVVKEVYRLTHPGRITAVHCMDVPRKGDCGLMDFPGRIIRLHEKIGFQFWARHFVWKEPLGVRNYTMAKGLAHKQIVEDSSLCDVASADHLLLFRKRGENKIPITHPNGLMNYAGSRKVPDNLLRYRGSKGKQRENKYSHWIWRQYASAFWENPPIDRWSFAFLDIQLNRSNDHCPLENNSNVQLFVLVEMDYVALERMSVHDNPDDEPHLIAWFSLIESGFLQDFSIKIEHHHTIQD